MDKAFINDALRDGILLQFPAQEQIESFKGQLPVVRSDKIAFYLSGPVLRVEAVLDFIDHRYFDLRDVLQHVNELLADLDDIPMRDLVSLVGGAGDSRLLNGRVRCLTVS